MIGTKFDKPLIDLEAYAECAEWCNENDAHIEEQETFYVVVANPAPTTDELAGARIAELKRLLDGTDYVVTKIAEGVATKEQYAEVLADRQAWREEINELEGETDEA